jgi:hypothetical protein
MEVVRWKITVNAIHIYANGPDALNITPLLA